MKIPEDGTYCDNTFEWCNDGIVPQIDQLQHMLEGELADYYKNFNEDGIFYCRDIHALPPESGAGSEAQGIKSMLQCDPRRRQSLGATSALMNAGKADSGRRSRRTCCAL